VTLPVFITFQIWDYLPTILIILSVTSKPLGKSNSNKTNNSSSYSMIPSIQTKKISNKKTINQYQYQSTEYGSIVRYIGNEDDELVSSSPMSSSGIYLFIYLSNYLSI
jgi:hypothetical protein